MGARADRRTHPGAEQGQRATLLDAALALGIGLLAAGVYAGSLGHAFVMDDRWLILRNPWIRDLGHLPELLTSSYYAPNMAVGLYRPVVSLSFALNHALGGLDPWGYHAMNLALHALASVALFAWIRIAGLGRTAAGVAASLFAVHAVHTEAVANVAGRAELLAGGFFLLALLCHAAREAGAGRGRGLYALTLVFYLLALLSKENAITWIPVVLLYDAVWLERERPGLVAAFTAALRQRAAIYAGYAAVTLAALGLRALALSGEPLTPPIPPIDNPLVMLEPPWRVLNALQVAWRAVGLLLFPLRLSYDYSYAQIPLITRIDDPRLWAVVGLTVVSTAAVLRVARPGSIPFLAAGFFALTYAVVSNLIVPIGTIFGERLLYLPSVGFCLAVGWAVARALARTRGRRWAQLAVGIVTASLVAAHAARSVVRTRDWADKQRLYLHDVEVSNRSAKALNNAGWILIDRDIDVARGVELLERALELWPDEPEYLDSLGWGYYKLGRLEEAERLLRRSLELDPRGPTAPDRRAHLRAVQEALRRARSDAR